MRRAPRIAVLDYDAGNLRSAEKALQRAGADASTTAEADVADRAEGLVVPGVGHFGQCVQRFRSHGLDRLVERWRDAGRPVLGICVGMQILFETSEEAPDIEGLGVLPGTVRRLPDDLVVPHMGWNVVEATRDDPLLSGVDGQHAYFVHSYYADPASPDEVVARTRYGPAFPSVVRVGSVAATQFHPEKSADVGARLLRNWVAEVRSGTRPAPKVA